MIDKEGIKQYIPHRDPFLFVDKVLEIEKGKRILAVKTFGPDQDFFKGHFPGYPVVPGVVITEALAQAGGVLIYYSFKEELDEMGLKGAYLMGVDNVKFRRVVEPNDEIKLDVRIEKRRSRVIKFKAEAFVGDSKAAEADISVSLY